MERVLVTGASGLIGGILRRGLSGRYELRGVDVTPIPRFDSLVADTTDLEVILPAFDGVDVVVDLAAQAQLGVQWGAVYANNIPSTYNVPEAARRAGVRRVVFASSNAVTRQYEYEPPYSDIVAGRYDGLDPSAIPLLTSRAPIRPEGPYGISKAFGEAAGRCYSDRYGLSVVCPRFGTVMKEGRPLEARHFATLLTHRDLVQLMTRCIEAPDHVRFAVFSGVSDNRWRFWDLTEARELIGFRPRDNAEKWRRPG